MAKKKVGVIAECVCDLPNEIIKEYDIDIVYFLVQTDTGEFTDTDEITAENIIKYLEAGGVKSLSSAPSSEVYVEAFKKKLEKYEEVVLPTISSHISNSYRFAMEAADQLEEQGRHVHVFDTGHLSTGLWNMVIRAGQLAKDGADVDTIVAELSDMKNRVSTSFITMNVDYLYRNGRVTKAVKSLCGALNAHPVLELKNGYMAVQYIEFGDYDKACMRYVRRQLKNSQNIDKTRAFITHANLPARKVEMIEKQVNKCCKFEELTVTAASATISCNCGPNAVGVLFVRN